MAYSNRQKNFIRSRFALMMLNCRWCRAPIGTIVAARENTVILKFKANDGKLHCAQDLLKHLENNHPEDYQRFLAIK